jgi:hypothetical protein
LVIDSTDIRTNAGGPSSSRIDQYLRTSQVNGVMFDAEEVSRKRPAPDDLSQSNKKQKAEPQVVIDPAISTAFLLDQTNPLALFDAQSIPLPIVVEAIVRTMDILPSQLLDDRLNVPSMNSELTIARSGEIINVTSSSTTGKRDNQRRL